MTMKEKVGLIGIGLVGTALAENLIQANKEYQNAKTGMEEKGAILWLEEIESEIGEADKPLVNKFLKELGSNLQLD